MAMDFGAHAALADYVVDATEALSFRSVGDERLRNSRVNVLKS